MNWKKAVYITTFLFVIITARTADAVPLEYKVKAGLIYNILKFVELPENKETSNINICVIGNNPFGDLLDKLNNKSIKGRKIVIIEKYDRTAKCSVAYISSSEEKKVGGIINELKASSVLTISDIDNFAKVGGMVEFDDASGNVVMYFNNSEAKRQGIAISSKLLQIARRVY